MSDNANELKQCTRCHSTILLKYFDINRNGEYYKTCRNCLTRDTATDRKYYEANKDIIAQQAKTWKEHHREQHLTQKKKYREENRDYILGKLTCECGSTHVRNGLSKHLRSLKHKQFMEVQALTQKDDAKGNSTES